LYTYLTWSFQMGKRFILAKMHFGERKNVSPDLQLQRYCLSLELEGGNTSTPEPRYFTGLVSCGLIMLMHCCILLGHELVDAYSHTEQETGSSEVKREFDYVLRYVPESSKLGTYEIVSLRIIDSGVLLQGGGSIL